MTAEELDLIRKGLARVYKGRLVPRIQGGATYTPATLITAKALGNGSGNVTTWQYQNTGAAGAFAVARSMVFTGQAGATGAVTVEQGVTGATASTSQRILDGVVMTANVPYFVNGWYVMPVNGFLQGYANSATVNGGAYGVTSVP